MRAERRVVTVLFADLAGYTAFCQERDPEEVHLLVRPLMRTLRALAEESGGLVTGIEGDGLMALFGAISATEDHPSRALDAAVRMQQLVQSRQSVLPELPSLHVGVHLGEVVVSWEDQTGPQVSGDVVNTASRLAGLAPGGTVLASLACAEVSGVKSGWGVSRSLTLRGRQGHVDAVELEWQAVSEVRGARWSHESPYVARPALEHALRTALDEGDAVLHGDAGQGKTRLVLEVLGHEPLVHVSCSEMRHPTARGVLIKALDQAGAATRETVDLLRHAAAPEGVLGPESAPVLAAAGRRLDSRHGVVLVDDAELLPDDEVADLLHAARASEAAWLLVTRRPLDVPGVPSLRVPGLAEDERDALVDRLLPGASRELRDVLNRRAGDSPLFLEQCARLMVESGAVRFDAAGALLARPERLAVVPTSMRLFVVSRLDLLGDAEREVLSVAAVLGEVPDLDLLRHLTSGTAEALEDLVNRGLLRWSRQGGRPVLRFSHALVRDVAYDTLLLAQRKQLHLAAAEWYAVLPVSHVLEAQATHLAAAASYGDPDCDLVRRAVETMVLFARSVEEERPRVAFEVLARARRLVEDRADCTPDTLVLDLALATLSLLAGRENDAAEAARRALDEATRRDDQRSAAEAHYHLGRTLIPVDDEAAADHLRRADEGYAQVGDPGGQARVAISRVFFGLHSTGVTSQLQHLESAHALALRSGDVRLQAAAAQQLAMHHGFSSGRPGFDTWRERARAVSRSDDAGLEPRLDTAAAALAMFELAPAKGLDEARQAVTNGRDLGLQQVYSNALIALLELLFIDGQLAQADQLLAEARAHAATRVSPWYSLQLDLFESRLRQRQGDVPSAVELLGRVASHELSALAVMRRDLAETRAWNALERGRFAEARGLAKESVLIHDEGGDAAPALRPRFLEVIATMAYGDSPPLGDLAALRASARETGLTTIGALVSRWVNVEELRQGWSVDLYNQGDGACVEARALDLEIEALSTRSWDRLLDSAAVWAGLGTTVWQARALLWHSELTGTSQPEADRLLEVLQSPAGLGEKLRAQVSALRG